MNEVGLDPGIDHLLAMECFDDSKDEGAVVRAVYILVCRSGFKEDRKGSRLQGKKSSRLALSCVYRLVFLLFCF